MGPLLDNFFNRQVLAQYGPSILGGFWLTVEVALLTIVVGVVTGLALAIVRAMRIKAADIAITIFVDLFRTLPQLVIIVFIYFGLPYADIQLSPFAASNQRAAEVPSARPTRDYPVSEASPGILSATPISATPILSGVPQVSLLRPGNVPSGAEPVTAGALALAEPKAAPDEETAPTGAVETAPQPGPQIVPDPAPSSTPEATDPLRDAVVEALTAGGHATAAVLLEDGQWTLDGSSIRIAVSAKATMIRLTFNAAAEKLIRQALTQAGAPGRFLIVPGEGTTSSGSAPRIRAALGSIEQEARNNPLVQQAQSLFNAEIITVIDLRT